MADVLLIAAASLYVWYVCAHSYVGRLPFGWARERFPLLVECPWCLGFWITGALSWTLGYDPMTHLAAAGIVGWAGTHVA